MEASRGISSPSLGASLLAVFGILLWRKTDAFLNPQFWAEDGTVFFQQAYEGGIETLWTTYAGYYHLVPRLVAWLASFAPFEIIPALYNGAALLAMGSVVVMLHSPRLHLPSPFAFSLVLVLVPHVTGEVFMNLTNTQWPLALLLVLTVLQKEPTTWRGLVLDLLILVGVGLSTPLIVLVLPILWIRAAWQRSVELGLEATVGSMVGGLQMLAFRQQPTVMAPSPDSQVSAWVEVLGFKTFGTLFMGRKWPYEQAPGPLLAVGVVFLGWMVWRLCRLSAGRRMALPALLFGLAACALAFYKFRDAIDLLVPAAAAMRYFYVLWVVIGWGLLVLVLRDHVGSRALASLLLLVILHSSLISVFRTPPFEDFAWDTYGPALEAREHVWVPINPPGWRIRLNEPDGPTSPQ